MSKDNTSSFNHVANSNGKSESEVKKSFENFSSTCSDSLSTDQKVSLWQTDINSNGFKP